MTAKTPSAARPRRRRAIALGLGTLLALLLLEGLLQVASFVTWQRRGALSFDGRRVALCVGDSFTWGLGASAPGKAYPAEAERRVRAAGVQDLAFVNAGWPGSTSRDVLAGLAALLQRMRPELVYVLVGTNDMWSWPDPLPPGAEESAGEQGSPLREQGFVLRWRTGRVALLAWNSLLGARAPAPAFVGAWESQGVQVDFWSDGTGGIAGEGLAWRQDGDAIVVRKGDGAELRVQWRVAGDQLELSSPAWPQPLRLSRGFTRTPRSARADPPAEQVACVQRAIEQILGGGDPAAAAADLHAAGTRVTPELFAAAAGKLDRAVPLDMRDRLLTLHATPLPVLDDHLRRIVRLCAQHGATPVLLTYPGGAFAKPEVEEVGQRVARELGIGLLDLRRAFTALAASGEVDVWAEDGHCNDRGYCEMGRVVAEHARTQRAR